MTAKTLRFSIVNRGGSRGASGGLGPSNFIKREKTLQVCARKRCFLVLNSYQDTPFQNPVSGPGKAPNSKLNGAAPVFLYPDLSCIML